MNEIDIKYPIKFIPILKEKIWGGKKLKKILNKNSDNNFLGESWELSGIQGDESVVANGSLIGETIKDLIQKFKGEIVGNKVFESFGNDFPLLFKFIDAKEDLSIQLHPNNKMASEKHNSYGKTEMWYVVDADIGAKLIVGFNDQYSKEEYAIKLKSGELIKMLNSFSIKRGDSFIIESGTIHTIGKGSLIAEIQQASDITYRVFDWNRKDELGNKRKLHNELAIDALDFTKRTSGEVLYSPKINESSNIVDCNYFTTNKVNVNSSYTLDMENMDSFLVYMCVEGNATVRVGDSLEEICKGETILIPAASKNVKITSDNAELLEVYIK